MSRTTKVVNGTLTGWIQFVLNIGLQVAIVPILLKVAGQETLGAYAILIQIIGYLALIDLGLSATTMRFLSTAYGYNDNGKRFRDVLSIARTCLLITNVLFSFLAVLLSIWLNKFVTLSDSLFLDARICIYMVAIWALVRSPWVVFAGGLIATQKMATVNIVNMIGNIFRLIMSIVLILAGMGLIGLILANILGEVVCTVLFTFIFKKTNRNLRLGWKIPDQQLLKEILIFGFYILIINTATLLIFSTSNILVGFLYGAVAASIYYTTQFPATSGYNLILTISRNAAPAINELYAHNDTISLQNVFLRMYKYTLLLIGPFVMGLILLNKSIIGIWAGPQQYAGDLMTWGLAGVSLIMCISGVSNVFVQAKGNIRFLSFLTLFEGIVNLILALWLGKLMGITGVLFAMFFAHIPTTIYLQWKTQKNLGINFLTFWKECIYPLTGIFTLAALLLIGLTKIIHPINWPSHIILVVIFLIIYAILIYRFALDEMEKLKMIQFIQKKVAILKPM